MPVRGFRRANVRTRGPDRDRLAGGDVLSNRIPGAPVIPRARVGAALTQPYPPLPAGWMNSLNEWIVFADLTRPRRFVLWIDFQFQAAVPAPGLTGKGFNRADFLILPEGKNGLVDAFYPRGLVLNPMSPFTHPSAAKDKIERLILGSNGFGEVFIEEVDLLQRPHFIVGEALRGRDLSSRGSG